MIGRKNVRREGKDHRRRGKKDADLLCLKEIWGTIVKEDKNTDNRHRVG